MLRCTSISLRNTIPVAANRELRTLHTIIREKPSSQQAQPDTKAESERQALNPERCETSKSGTDSQVAGYKSSYDPSTTTPESELQALEKECRLAGIINPLFISPANREFSELLDPTVELGAVHAHDADKLGAGSGRGWTRKGKEVHVRKYPGGPFERYERLLGELKKRREGLASKWRTVCAHICMYLCIWLLVNTTYS